MTAAEKDFKTAKSMYEHTIWRCEKIHIVIRQKDIREMCNVLKYAQNIVQSIFSYSDCLPKVVETLRLAVIKVLLYLGL